MSDLKYILYIGEDDDDCSFIREAISKLDSSVTVKCEFTGFGGISFLAETVQNGLPLPNMIVIDLDMPAISGDETLLRLRSIHELNSIPILFFSNGNQTIDF